MAGALPWIKPRYFDSSGKPLSGGKVFTYIANSSTPAATYTDSGGLTANPNPYILDADGYGNIWMKPGIYKIVLKDSTDVILWTIDNVKPNDGGGGGITDSDYTYSGYSARFGSVFGPSTGLNDTLTKILQITYSAPTISLSASGSGTIREKGTAVTSSTLTASVGLRSDPIANVKFYFNATLLSTQTSGGAVPSGGNSTYSWTGSFSDNNSFSASATDTGATGGPSSPSSVVNFVFVYPYYYGAGATGKTGAQIRTDLTNDVSQVVNTKIVIFSASVGNRLYFAYPASSSSLISILDVNGFETLPDWTLNTVSITGLDTTSQSYKVYTFNNLVGVAGSIQYTFKR